MAGDLSPEFELPTEAERRAIEPDDMAQYYKYHRERRRLERLDGRISGGIYEDVKRED